MRHPFLLLLLLPLLFSCGDSQENVAGDSAAVAETVAVPFRNWVNVDYVACMDTSCPCECWSAVHEKQTTGLSSATMITLDSVNGSLQAHVYSYNMDADQWTLTRNAKGDLDARRSNNEVVATLAFAENMLLLEYNGDTGVFISYPGLETHRDAQYVYNLNAFLLKQTFAGSDTLLRSLFALDSTTLSCSPELGNVITAPKLEVHKTWIVQPRGTSIALYQYVGDGNKKQEIPAQDTVFAGVFPRK